MQTNLFPAETGMANALDALRTPATVTVTDKGPDALLKAEVTQSIKQFLLIAEKHYGKTYSAQSVSYDLKSTVGGTASYSLWHIQANPRMLVENKDDYLINTIGHEVAHLITFDNYGKRTKAHGKEWAATMAVLGLKPERCHSYKAYSKPRKRLKRFLYVCKCNIHHHITGTRRRRIDCGSGFHCARCGHYLRNDGFSETEHEAREWKESEKKRLKKEVGKVSSAAARERDKQWLEYEANLWMGG